MRAGYSHLFRSGRHRRLVRGPAAGKVFQESKGCSVGESGVSRFVGTGDDGGLIESAVHALHDAVGVGHADVVAAKGVVGAVADELAFAGAWEHAFGGRRAPDEGRAPPAP